MAISKKELEALKKKVALGNQIMFYQGLADYHGHVSARLPGTRQFLIKPVLAPLGFITSKDIMVVDIDKYYKVCEENYSKAGRLKQQIKMKIPPRETMIHAMPPIYRLDHHVISLPEPTKTQRIPAPHLQIVPDHQMAKMFGI